MAEPTAEELGFAYLPDEERDLSADDELDAAEAALDEQELGAPEEAGQPPVPFGRTWAFDFGRQRFSTRGAAPGEVRGHEALKVWLETAANTERFSSSLFSDEYGVERLDEVIGEIIPGEEELDGIEEALYEALTVHERVLDLDEFAAEVEDDGTVTFSFRVVTDENETVDLLDLIARPEDL